MDQKSNSVTRKVLTAAPSSGERKGAASREEKVGSVKLREKDDAPSVDKKRKRDEAEEMAHLKKAKRNTSPLAVSPQRQLVTFTLCLCI